MKTKQRRPLLILMCGMLIFGADLALGKSVLAGNVDFFNLVSDGLALFFIVIGTWGVYANRAPPDQKDDK